LASLNPYLSVFRRILGEIRDSFQPFTKILFISSICYVGNFFLLVVTENTNSHVYVLMRCASIISQDYITPYPNKVWRYWKFVFPCNYWKNFTDFADSHQCLVFRSYLFIVKFSWKFGIADTLWHRFLLLRVK